MKAFIAIPLLGLLESVLAHGSTPSALINSKKYTGVAVLEEHPPGSDAIGWNNPWLFNHPFVVPSELSTPDIICSAKGTPGPSHATINAGDTMTIQWTVWDESHSGPILSYLAPCNGPCETVNPADLKFFKIAHRGLVGGPKKHGQFQKYASDELIANGHKWDVVIPKDIPSGNYTLRHEIIAIHFAFQDNGAQFYPQCMNLEIVGGSGAVKPVGVPATELYEPDHPGIFKLDLHDELVEYPIPGPALYNAGGTANAGTAIVYVSSVAATKSGVAGGSVSSTASSTVSSSSTSSTSSTTSTSSTSSASSASSTTSSTSSTSTTTSSASSADSSTRIANGNNSDECTPETVRETVTVTVPAPTGSGTATASPSGSGSGSRTYRY